LIRTEMQMTQEFHFEDGGRTFRCSLERPNGSRTEAWWWFAVTGDQHRYAPFQAAADDTEATVRSRIAAYYSDLLERRAHPAPPRSHWSRRRES
jgi:hypothetical protein